MTDVTPAPESLESLQARHCKEQRDLVSRITQKKKQATKKTRKGVQDECERLERELKERQAEELGALNGDAVESDHELSEVADDSVELAEKVRDISLDNRENGTTDHGSDNVSGKKKPNRAKTRLARRAAEQEAMVREAEIEAANAPNPREIERERMATQLERHNLKLHEIRADGHCLYAAVADQLETRQIDAKPRISITTTPSEKSTQGYQKVRNAAADWIEGNADDFAGFLEDPLPEHVRKIRETGEWGGHVELLALARTYAIKLCVLHSDGRVDCIEPEAGPEEAQEAWLGYYKHSHGLGEHYNSLRPKD